MLKNILLSLPLLIITACCPPKSSITLLPDSDGGIGAVDITLTDESNAQISLETPFQSIAIEDSKHKVANLSEKDIAKNYPKISKAEINMDNKISLYFDSGQDQLSGTELQKIDTILTTIKNNLKSDLLVIGYADATGNSKYNLQLSKTRAIKIAAIISEKLSIKKDITVKYHGDKRSKIDSQMGANNAKARRVDIIFY